MISAISHLSFQNKVVIIVSSLTFITGLFCLLAANQILPPGTNVISELEGAQVLGAILLGLGIMGFIFSGKIQKKSSLQKSKKALQSSPVSAASPSPATIAPAKHRPKSSSSTTLPSQATLTSAKPGFESFSPATSQETIVPVKKVTVPFWWQTWSDQKINKKLDELNSELAREDALYPSKGYMISLSERGFFLVGCSMEPKKSAETSLEHQKECDLCKPSSEHQVLETFPEERCTVKIHAYHSLLYVVLNFEEGEKILSDWFSASREQQIRLIKATFRVLNKIDPALFENHYFSLQIPSGYLTNITHTETIPAIPHLHIVIKEPNLHRDRMINLFRH